MDFLDRKPNYGIMSAPPTQKPEEVRIATRKDEARIFRLLTEGPTSLANENAMYPVAPAKVLQRIKQATQGQGGIIGLMEHEGHIAGSVGVFLSQYWYTDKWHVEELWNFVHPDFRRLANADGSLKGVASTLVDFAKWANEQMNVALHMGIMTLTRMEGKARLYDRKLLRIGAFFMNPPLPGKAGAEPVTMEAADGR